MVWAFRLLVALVLANFAALAWVIAFPRIAATPALAPAVRASPAGPPPQRPTGVPAGPQLGPSPGASGIPYGKARHDLTSIPIQRALAHLLAMQDQPLTPRQARQLIPLAEAARAQLAREKGVNRAFHLAVASVLTPAQQAYMASNFRTRLNVLEEELKTGDLFDIVLDFVEKRAAEATPVLPSPAPFTEHNMPAEEQMRGFLALEESRMPITSRQAAQMLPSIRDYVELRNELRRQQRALVAILTDGQRARLTEIHHDVTGRQDEPVPHDTIMGRLREVAR